MGRAIDCARRGLEAGQMPIGAVVALGESIVAEAFWMRNRHGALLQHPKVVALRAADPQVSGRRASTALYTTLEPCLMCIGAAMSFFVGRVVYAVASPTDGATRVAEQWSPPRGHPLTSPRPYVPQIRGGVCDEEVRVLLREYLALVPDGPDAQFAETLLQGAHRRNRLPRSRSGIRTGRCS